MIKIKIGEPEKLTNNILVKKSAFVSFDYNPDIVSFIKQMGTRVYNPDNHTWEMPINNIIGLCNKFENQEIQISGIYEDLHKQEFEIDIPKDFEFKTKPFNHQIDGVRFGLNKKKFLLCDDQGLGKTKQIIDLVGCLEKTDTINKVLIVCGVNSLKYNWQLEIGIHSDEKGWVLGTRYRKTTGKAYEGSTKDKLADLDNLPDCRYLITNIETLRAGAEKISKSKYHFPVAEKLAELCKKGIISVIAFDECHKSKDPTSLQSRAMSLLSAPYMAAMSGTPLMNNPLDLYFPLSWLGYEKHSFYQFKQHYCTLGGWGGSQVVGYKNLEEIRALMDEVMLRRLKTEVLDLPEKIRKIEYVDMTAKQAQIYKEVYMGVMNELQKIKFSNNPLSMMIRLRQATGWTGILSQTVQESAKMDRMVELIEEISASGQKAIVFSNWESMTEVAKEKLKAYNPAYITGATKADERMKEVDRFQNDDKCRVIIGTIGAMGTGLTLTAAQNVIFLDSPWNMALKAQAEDRAHRIGTKGTVNIITLVCKNTIDERIEELVEKKGQIADALVDGKISVDDINFLLS
jgi:SNF2 family DNA or RNA helicase|nr:MAG TPA: Chromatin remodeling complex ATPase [Caudoviricetes sp.]